MDGGSEGGGDNGLGENYLEGNRYVVEDFQLGRMKTWVNCMLKEAEDLPSDDGSHDGKNDEPLREQDRFLPIANVARIMKKSIPSSGKIAKDAKECVQECVSEFISFITSEASERCHQEKRKTINGEDILFAMSTLGFDNYVEPLKLYLQKYRESSKGEKVMNASGGQEGSMEELSEDFSANLSSGILTDGSGQQSVIYTTAYPQGTINFSSLQN